MVTGANAQPAAYPLNRRGLSGDVTDVFVSIITNGKVTRDNVEPITIRLARFPYLGAAYMARLAERTRAVAARKNVARAAANRHWQQWKSAKPMKSNEEQRRWYVSEG